MTCRELGCGAEIQFIRNQRGRAVPVPAGEPEAIYLHQGKPGHPQVVVVLENGEILRGRRGSRHDNGVMRVMGWESHISVCPGRAGARRAGEEP